MMLARRNFTRAKHISCLVTSRSSLGEDLESFGRQVSYTSCEIPQRSSVSKDESLSLDSPPVTIVDQELGETVPESLQETARKCIADVNNRCLELLMTIKIIKRAREEAKDTKKKRVEDLKSTFEKLMSGVQEAFQNKRDRIEVFIRGTTNTRRQAPY
jgi:hypothetical protein